MAADERTFNLRCDFYAEVVEYLQLLETWMVRTHPLMRPSPAPPELPLEEADVRRLSARLTVFASPAVREAAIAFMHGFRGFQGQVTALQSVRSQYGAKDDGSEDAKHERILEQRRLVDDAKEKTVKRMRSVEQLMAAEIAPNGS